jgi:hypothetical protein
MAGSQTPTADALGHVPAAWPGIRVVGRNAWTRRRGLRGVVLSALVLLPGLFIQGCTRPETGALAKGDRLVPQSALSEAASGKGDRIVPRAVRTAKAEPRKPKDSFDARFGAPAKVAARKGPDTGGERTGSLGPGSYQVASLSPDLPYEMSPVKEAQTRLIGFDSSAFPYSGRNPRTGGGSYAEGSRYSDNRVLVHVPTGFDVKKPGVIVVFFHGHGATLERDVRDRQLVPQQISESGVNAVLVAPQLAYDAADSSAGKFWERGGFKRFMAEAAEKLAKVYGDARAAKAFAKMPVVIVAYSGGFVSAAYCLQVGGLGSRVRGVVLLDALYGEMDKFSSWIAGNRSAFFVSAYTHYTKRRDDELARILKDKGIAVARELNGPLKPGTVAFLGTPEGLRHRDYVTMAWTEHPVKDVLTRLAQR